MKSPAVVLLSVIACAASANDVPTRSSQVTYSVSIEAIPEGAKSLDLWLPIAQDTDGQRVSRVEVVRPEGGSIATEAKYGNKIWHKRFEGPFTEPIEAELVFDIHRTELSYHEAKHLAVTPRTHGGSELYLRSNKLIPIDFDPIKAIAADLKLDADPPIIAARKAYDWLIDEFTYNWQAPGAGKGDVRWACDSRTGDCNDYHSMFIALMRHQGIPADHEFGYPIRIHRSAGRIPSYHCWARFYVEGVGWIPIDASEADKHPELRDYNFGSQSQDLFKFTHGRDVDLVPQQKGPALNKFIHPYVEVDGVPFEDGINYRVDYEDIE